MNHPNKPLSEQLAAMSSADITLMCGEMTKQELRTAKAVLNYVTRLVQATEQHNRTLEKLAFLVGSIFFYGGFRIETHAESELAKLLEDVGCLYSNEAELVKDSQKYGWN